MRLISTIFVFGFSLAVIACGRGKISNVDVIQYSIQSPVYSEREQLSTFNEVSEIFDLTHEKALVSGKATDLRGYIAIGIVDLGDFNLHLEEGHTTLEEIIEQIAIESGLSYYTCDRVAILLPFGISIREKRFREIEANDYDYRVFLPAFNCHSSSWEKLVSEFERLSKEIDPEFEMIYTSNSTIAASTNLKNSELEKTAELLMFITSCLRNSSKNSRNE